MKPVITKRLIIRRMQENDLPDFLAYQTHPLVLQYMPVEAMTEEQAISFLAQQAIVEIGDNGGYIAFGIYHRDDAKIIGEVGIYLLPKIKSQGEIGWSLHPKYQGFGYATEAAEVLLAYGFAQLELHRITSGCDLRNVASFRLMERLGMRREGHLRQSKFMKDAWQDEYIYALLHHEWLSQRKY